MRRLAAALAGCAALAAGAQQPAYWYLQVDNDVIFATDRWYTSGSRLSRVSDHGDYEVEIGVMQEIYTPETKHFTLGTTDRGPTALLLASIARHDRIANCFQTIALGIGVRGPSALGERTTDFVHRFIQARDVDWRQEEEDQLAARITFTRSQRFEPAVVHYGAVIGTDRTFLHAAAEWRTGADLASSTLRFAPTPPPRGGPSTWGAFVGAGVRAVAKDDLFSRSYDLALAAPERERAVGRLAAGIGIVRGWGSAILTLGADSREFRGQREGHRFGSLVVHYDF